MADLSAFSSSTFSTTAWINAALQVVHPWNALKLKFNNFATQEYISDDSNIVQDSHHPIDGLESFISSLTMKLHIMSQDYTDQLETAMVGSFSSVLYKFIIAFTLKVESMATMPRILAEINRVEDQLKAIEFEMATLTEQLNSLDQRNVAGVEDLSRLVQGIVALFYFQ